MCMCASLLTVLLRLNMPDCLLLSAVSWCLSMLRSCCICLPLPILLHIMHQAEACCFIASDTEYIIPVRVRLPVCEHCSLSNQAQASKTVSSSPRISQIFTGLLKWNINVCAFPELWRQNQFKKPQFGDVWKHRICIFSHRLMRIVVIIYTSFNCHRAIKCIQWITQWPHCNTVVKMEIWNFTQY